MGTTLTENRNCLRGLRAAAPRGVALGAAIIGLAATQAAAAPSNIVMRQLTNITTGTIESPKLQLQDGRDIAFASNGDVLGPGTQTANRQIYLWHENEFTGAGTITKLTNGVGCDSYDPARPTDTIPTDRPKLIAFVSTCNFDPTVGNVDGNPEIFFYGLESQHIWQITKTVAPVVNADPFTSDSGRCLVFTSNADLDNNNPSNPHYDSNRPGPGHTNPDSSNEVFLYGLLDGTFEFPFNGTFTQLSNGPSGTTSNKPVVGGYIFSRQCQTAAFQSDYDQSGTGLTGQIVFVYNAPDSSIEVMNSEEIAAHGLPSGMYQNPAISEASPFARGPNLVFESSADVWNNGSTGNEVYNFRLFHPRVSQYTNVGSPFEAKFPQVSDGGGVVTFQSNGELLTQKREAKDGSMPPFNADGNYEIFRLKGRKTITQITRTTGCTNSSSTLMDDGNRVGFVSDCDIVPGENAGHRTQVFLYARERGDAGILTSGNCTQANGCCYVTHDGSTCYSDLTSAKPDISRPNCLDRDSCID